MYVSIVIASYRSLMDVSFGGDHVAWQLMNTLSL